MPDPDAPATPGSAGGGAAGRSAAFRILLAAALLGVGWLVHPYFQVLTIAVITAVLASPVHVGALRVLRGRSYTAAVTTTTLLTVGVFVPLAGLAWLLSRELVRIANLVVLSIREGGLDRVLDALDSPWVAGWLTELGVDRQQLAAALADGVQQVSVGVAGGLAAGLPNFFTQTAGVLLDIVVFYLSVVTLLARGPDILNWVGRVSPLDPRYLQRLFDVFASFARNVVLAGLVCGVLQGFVAAVGYWIAGVDRPFVFGVLTGVLTYVPFVGTALVWVPLTANLALAGDWGRALFVLAWSIIVTASVDNVVRPLIVRGQSGIHPLLILLGVLGGLEWIGIVGVLIGPVLVAMLVTLLTLYTEEVAQKR
ncbi:MAG: AI-2E family transporter [Pseudomonadota bacterium]|nr:AI-2E family transporter [Pseudomonadota bacterium]